MVQESRQDQHERLHNKSYKNLTKAREEAARKEGYDSQKTRELKRLFREQFGKDPYEWQLDITEAIILSPWEIFCRHLEDSYNVQD
jgi:hypothetical protein